jgi:hypothetical protein
VQWDVAVEFGLLEDAFGPGTSPPLEDIAASLYRTVNWFSFTVPQGRSDEDYFAPLRDLQAGPGTELYFALVPYYPDDQAPGTTAKQVGLIDASLAQSPSGNRDWGISTECGMGRVASDDVPTLLDLHREILVTADR